MGLFKSVLDLIFQSLRLYTVPVLTALLLFYLVISAFLVFVRIVKGVRG